MYLLHFLADFDRTSFASNFESLPGSLQLWQRCHVKRHNFLDSDDSRWKSSLREVAYGTSIDEARKSDPLAKGISFPRPTLCILNRNSRGCTWLRTAHAAKGQNTPGH